MRSEQEVGLWRMVLGVAGVTALGLGVSLQLEAASRPVHEPAADNASSAVTHAAATPLVKPAAANRRPRRAPTDAETRVKAGTIPAAGLGVIATVYVDWRDDEGTRLRQAGKLIGPMPGPGDQAGGVADGGWYPHGCAVTGPGECSFAVDCDDNDPCTTDRCDFVFGSAACTGTCVHDPVADDASGGCDDGLFCNGKETCQGAECTTVTAPNVLGQSCKSHASCGEDGTCNVTDHVCTAPAGRVGDACNANEDCNVAGRCSGGPTPNAPCDSDATCGGGTCTVKGRCGPGQCTNGTPAICCDDPDPIKRTVCAEQFPRCDDNSVRPGIGCDVDPLICKGGLCERCQPSCTQNSDCADGRKCNGDETCERTCVGGPTSGIVCTIDANCNVGGSGGLCLGQCHPGLNPCGAGGRCAEKKCGTITPPVYCLSDADCPAGSPCVDIFSPPAALCFLGRCCDPAASDANSCLIKKLSACSAITNSLWYMDDDGEQLQAYPCGGYNPADLTRDPFGCPKYSSGLTQHVAATPPIYPVMVGPISDSRACVPVPGGPGAACADPFDPAGRLYQLGDDYKVPNSSYLGLDVARFVLNVVNLSRLSLDIYDKDGNFVEDMNVGFQSDLVAGLGIVVVIFRAPLTIPPEGWIVLRTAERFLPNSKAFWLSTTTTAGSAGSNYPNALWINGYPGLASTVNNNFLKMCVGGPKANQACVTDADCPGSTCGAAPGILAFELAGDKVPAPVGSCCDSASGECEDGVLSWVCAAQGMIYNGDGTYCGVCNGGINMGRNCRTCSNATSTFCAKDSDCPSGGNCQPDNSKCPSTSGVCSTGLVGMACTITVPPQVGDDSCDEAGICNLPTLTCVTGNVGQACILDADCDVQGTCVPVACQPIAGCAQGACCNPDPLVCNSMNSGACCTLASDETACTNSGGVWQGYGTDCDADHGYDGPGVEQHCCRIPDYSGLRCMSGPNNLQPCTDDANCRFCVGGSLNGEVCTTTSAAEPNGCLNEGVCTTGACVGGLPPTPNVCLTDTDCPDNSGVCRGRCVSRGTGGDNCMDAYVHVITVPTLSEGPKTVTISGTNIAASSSDEEPENCSYNGIDPGWWEGFAIDKCARVRLDFCCSDPIRQPAYTFLYPDCTCQDPISSAPDPYTAGQSDAGQGQPYCDDDNTWATFPPLQEGTYYYPINSALAGAHGAYQMHVTVQACPTAACCYLECAGGPGNGQYCDKNNPCPGGTCLIGGAPCDQDVDCTSGLCSVSCDSVCLELDKFSCDAKLGYYLGPPNVHTAVPLCLGSPCAEGSCCVGPGVCKDERDNFGLPMTQAACEQNFDGIFVGGVACYGGRCADTQWSCSPDLGQTCENSAACNGTADDLDQALPCPVCVIEGAGNCQRFENAPDFSMSDIGTGSGMKMADDFVLTAPGDLETVCVWGLYDETDLTVVGTDCGGPEQPPADQRPDSFRVRVYEDVDGAPGGGACSTFPYQRCILDTACNSPGLCVPTPLGESTVSNAHRTKAVVPGAATATSVIAANTWAFQLVLDNPIPNLQAGKCYWLEVTNNTPDAVFGTNCTWHWSNLLKTSTQGNKYSAAGSETNGYVGSVQRNWDQAFCLGLSTSASIAPGGCASQPKACCSCQNACTSSTLSVCDDAAGVWHEDDATCPTDCAPPPNDRCVDVTTPVPVGLYSVSTQCAVTDGPNPVVGRVNANIENDVWYFFKPISDCRLRADSCTSGTISFFDSAIAIYHNVNDPTHCPCPANAVEGDAMMLDASDDDCVILGSATGGVAEADVLAGKCYTIRFGGFPGDDQVGRAAVEISCGPPKCGDGRKNGSEQCDGLDNSSCRTAVPSTLCIMHDPVNPATDCKCGAQNPCGNGILDSGEECDPGSPGVPCPQPLGASGCYQAGNPLQCTCKAVCGNDYIEAGEDCDCTHDAVCSGRCQTRKCVGGTHAGDCCTDNTECTGGTCGEGDCRCPPLACGNGRLEPSAGEQCEFGKCLVGGDNCTQDSDCTSGGCDKTADRADCESGNCRPPGDPLGGCTCACPTVPPPPGNIVWDSSATSPDRATRSLRFKVTAPATATAAAAPGENAIKVTMVDLQNPVPPNAPCCPPQDFHTYESATCTAAGEANGCARWVGKPGTFYEGQGPPLAGPYRAARLQCTPFYFDWITETATTPITVVGAEILPSSTYTVQAYGASCMGSEAGCTNVSAAVPMLTRRSGDVWPQYNPPSTARQPDGIDIVVIVNRFKLRPGAPSKAVAQLQPNLPELNTDVNAFDIVTVINAFRGYAYPFSGPCPCPSTVTCGGTCSGCAGMCVKTCIGGANAGDPCIDNNHCPGSTCGSGFCRDRCGRCK